MAAIVTVAAVAPVAAVFLGRVTVVAVVVVPLSVAVPSVSGHTNHH